MAVKSFRESLKDCFVGDTLIYSVIKAATAFLVCFFLFCFFYVFRVRVESQEKHRQAKPGRYGRESTAGTSASRATRLNSRVPFKPEWHNHCSCLSGTFYLSFCRSLYPCTAQVCSFWIGWWFWCTAKNSSVGITPCHNKVTWSLP